MKEITAFNKEWYEDTTIRKFKVLYGIDVILEKKAKDCYVNIHLENIKTPPIFGYVPSDSSVLINVFTPEDSDGTDDDIKRKIDAAIEQAIKVWESITEEQVKALEDVFKKYEAVTHEVYAIKNKIGKSGSE